MNSLAMEHTTKLVVGITLIAFCYALLLKAHRNRSVNRPLIYQDLYGPLLFMLVIIPVFAPIAWGLGEVSWMDLFLMVLSVPLFFQLLIFMAMVARLFIRKRTHQDPEICELQHHPKVAIILPTYKEPFEIARMTLDSLIAMEYDGDLKIIVVDNSEDHEDLASWEGYVTGLGELFMGSNLTVEWISRDPTLKGYKPLNLDVAYQDHIANDWEVEYVMYVDTDSTFHENTLTDLMKTFAEDDQAAYVQLMTVANNMDVNGLSRAVGMQQTIFRYVLGEIGHWGMPIFYGHNAIFRRDVIPQLGDFLETDSRGELILTEDFSMTIRTYLHGGYGKTRWIHSGEGVPTSLAALKGMWDRWAIGGLQVLVKYFHQVILSRKINFYEKVSFLFHAMSYPSQAMIPLLILVSPMMEGIAHWALALVVLNAGLSAYGFKSKFAPVIDTTQRDSPPLSSYYLSFFAVSNYIIWVMFLATWKFFYRFAIPKKYREKLTWVVTPKGKEEKMQIIDVLNNNASIFVFVGLFMGISGYVLSRGFQNTEDLLVLLPGGFFCFNLLLTLLVFGRSRKATSKPSVKTPLPEPPVDLMSIE